MSRLQKLLILRYLQIGRWYFLLCSDFRDTQFILIFIPSYRFCTTMRMNFEIIRIRVVLCMCTPTLNVGTAEQLSRLFNTTHINMKCMGYIGICYTKRRGFEWIYIHSRVLKVVQTIYTTLSPFKCKVINSNSILKSQS